MFKRIAAVAVALAALLVAAPAEADEWVDVPPYRFAETTICVIKDPAVKGWRVGAAVRAWNEAQPYVRLHLATTPFGGCAVLRITQVPGSPMDDWNGYANIPGSDEVLPGGALGIHGAEIVLNRSSLAESRTPAPGCDRKRTVAHEIGHTLGIYNHTTGVASVMSPNHDWVRFCGTPSIADARLIAGLYA